MCAWSGSGEGRVDTSLARLPACLFTWFIWFVLSLGWQFFRWSFIAWFLWGDDVSLIWSTLRGWE
jgi:hypothetical protein